MEKYSPCSRETASLKSPWCNLREPEVIPLCLYLIWFHSPRPRLKVLAFLRGFWNCWAFCGGELCLCLYCKFIPLGENHHQVKASLPKGKTLPLGNLLWQVDAGLIPVLRNILRLVLTNWPLMESVFVGPDSCREHLQSCFNGDWVLMAQKSACSPVKGTQTFFAWALAMCKNMTFYCNPAENDKVASKHSMGMSDSADKGLLQRKECSLLFPPMSSRENKSRGKETQDLAAFCTQLFSALRSSRTLPLCCASI